MTFEDQVDLALRAEALRIDPPITDLVEGGVARGRRLQRRHRARMVATGAVLTLVAGVGSVLAVPSFTGVGGSGPVAADDTAGGDGGGGPAGDAPAELDPDAVLDAVSALLPPGEITHANASSHGPTSAWVDFVYDDGDGASWMSATVTLAAVGATPSCTAALDGICEDRMLDDGTTVLLEAGPYYHQEGREPGRLQWRATAASPSGLTVRLDEMNAPSEKRSELTRAEPPLTLDQLAAVVTDDVWRELTAGLPVESEEDRAAQEAADEAAAAVAALEEARVGAELAADLGPGWVGGGLEMPRSAVPSPGQRAGLPEGYHGAVVNRDVFATGSMTLEDLCAPGVEKGLESLPCEPAGEGVWIHRVQSVGEIAAGDPVQDDVSVLYVDDDGMLSHVRVWVSEPAEASTPERRAAALTWLDEQVEALTRAAMAAVVEPGR